MCWNRAKVGGGGEAGQGVVAVRCVAHICDSVVPHSIRVVKWGDGCGGGGRLNPRASREAKTLWWGAPLACALGAQLSIPFPSALPRRSPLPAKPSAHSPPGDP